MHFKRGFKFYGLMGIIFILLAQLNFIFKIEPFASWYFPIIWFGYILAIDAVVYKIKGSSLIAKRAGSFAGIVLLSAVFWYVFELANIFLGNWAYSGLGRIGFGQSVTLLKLLSFSTVLPALFETSELIRSLNLFESKKLKKSHKITKRFIIIMITLGIICFVLPILFPKYTFPLIWLSFFFLLDPINYLHKQPSIIAHIKDRMLAIPLSLMLAGIILGFFWEFWNYWAIPKWTYSIPYVGFFKIFEMPVLGYLGYFPFALELYAMYWFVRSLFTHKEHLLTDA